MSYKIVRGGKSTMVDTLREVEKNINPEAGLSDFIREIRASSDEYHYIATFDPFNIPRGILKLGSEGEISHLEELWTLVFTDEEIEKTFDALF